MTAEDLELTDIQVRDVGQLDGEVLYEADAPLTDIQIADNGSMVCLKKAGGKAELLYFESGYAKPDLWVTSEKLRLAGLFAFDGKRVYAHTEKRLLMLEPGSIRDLYVTRGPVLFPSISPNGRSVVWVEGDAYRRGYVLELDQLAKAHRVALRDCSLATWLGTGEIVALEIGRTSEDEEECVLSLHSPDGSLKNELLTTDMGIGRLTGDPHDRIFTVDASRLHGGRGIWLIDLNEGIQTRRIAPVLPTGGVVLSHGCCFCGENLPWPAPHTLICASKHFTGRATVSDPISDFAVDSAREWLVYRTYGATGSLKRISLAAFTSKKDGSNEMS